MPVLIQSLSWSCSKCVDTLLPIFGKIQCHENVLLQCLDLNNKETHAEHLLRRNGSAKFAAAP